MNRYVLASMFALATALCPASSSAAIITVENAIANGDTVTTPDGDEMLQGVGWPETNGTRVSQPAVVDAPGIYHRYPVFYVDGEATFFGETPEVLDVLGTHGVLPNGDLVFATRTGDSTEQFLPDSIYHTSAGFLFNDGDAAPSAYTGATFTSFADVRVDDDGTVVFAATLSGAAPGETRHGLYRSTDGTLANTTEVYVTGIDASHAGFFDVAPGGPWVAAYRTTVDTGRVLVDGTVVLEAGDMMTGAETFAWPDDVAIRNDGAYLVTGRLVDDTVFLAFEDTVALVPGDTVAGFTLADVLLVALSNDDRAALLLQDTGGTRHVVLACDPSDVAGSSIIIASEGDEVDIDGNRLADYPIGVLSDTGGRQLALTDDERVGLTFHTAPSGGQVLSAVFPASCCGNGVVDSGESCDDGDPSPECNAQCEVAACGDGHIDVGEDCDDGRTTSACDHDCTTAQCGDGTLNMLAGEDCDEGAETAECNADCSASVCGDGVQNSTAGEDCDPGASASADCDLDCTPAVCGDGTLNEAAREQCDDGNVVGDDGCTSACTLEDDPGSTGSSGSSTNGDGSTTGDPGTTSGFASEGPSTTADADTGVGSATEGETDTEPAANEPSNGCGCRWDRDSERRRGHAVVLVLAALGLRRRSRWVHRPPTAGSRSL